MESAASIMRPAFRSTSSFAFFCRSWYDTYADTPIPAANTSTRTMLNLSLRPIVVSSPLRRILPFGFKLMNLAAWLARAATSEPARIAIFRGDRPWADYGTLAKRVARLAAGLRSRHGLAAGDRVALVMKNAPEYLEAMYAIWWAGLAAVPVNAKLHPREVEFIVADSGAKLVIDDPSKVAALAASEPMP